MTDISYAIRAALLTSDPRAKVMATRALVRDWRQGRLMAGFTATMPDRPAWPANLKVLAPAQMPRRGKGGSLRGRVALWHALAHIEFVAIDLAVDMVGRFGGEFPPAFVDDWIGVAADEAMHFALLDRRLAGLGSH